MVINVKLFLNKYTSFSYRIMAAFIPLYQQRGTSHHNHPRKNNKERKKGRKEGRESVHYFLPFIYLEHD
jgi:hypothetical protein